MARAPRQTQDPAAKSRYFIADKDATHLGDIVITKEHRKDGIDLSERQAMSFLASGTVSTVDPSESKTARQAVAANQADSGQGGQGAPAGRGSQGAPAAKTE